MSCERIAWGGFCFLPFFGPHVRNSWARTLCGGAASLSASHAIQRRRTSFNDHPLPITIMPVQPRGGGGVVGSPLRCGGAR